MFFLNMRYVSNARKQHGINITTKQCDRPPKVKLYNFWYDRWRSISCITSKLRDSLVYGVLAATASPAFNFLYTSMSACNWNI